MMNKIWLAPKNKQELQQALAEKGALDSLVCGGTDLLIAHKKGKPVHGWIDLSQAPFLQKISWQEDKLVLGSAVTYDEIARQPEIWQRVPALAKAASLVGSQQIRNRGTIGGGIANASPASDIIPVLHCLQANLLLLDGAGGERRILLSEFVLGAGKTALQTDECILQIEIPLSQQLHSAYVKLGPRSQVAIAEMTATAVYSILSGKIADFRLVVGSIGVQPVPMPEAAAIFQGKTPLDLGEEEATVCAEFYQDYILHNVAAEFHRDYKAVAIYGILEDLLLEIKKEQ